MSRIGRKPVVIPGGVTVEATGNTVKVKGPHGELSLDCHQNMRVTLDEDGKNVLVERPDDQRQNRALHGLTRSLIQNMVDGVATPFLRKLEIQGVGYNAQLNGDTLALRVGFANTVELKVPQGVTCVLPDPTHIHVTSPDKQAAGQFAADIRAVRPPEPYKGKGIRYDGEHVRRKAGKAFGAK